MLTAELGPDVEVRAEKVSIGRNVRIGTTDDENAFRFPGGTRIHVRELVLGDNVRIGRHVLIQGGRIELKRDCRVGHGSTIKVSNEMVIGEHGIVNEQCEIAGVDVAIGRELWMLPTAKIGGGSALDAHSSLRAGHWLHLGMRSLVNTARAVVLGDEVGLGTGTALYTHGAYPSAWEGKPAAFGPITIGDRSWLPGAVVNPSVTIGSDCVIGVGSVVTRDIPSGSMAAGAPARVIKERAYPRELLAEQRAAFMGDFLRTFNEITGGSGTPIRYAPSLGSVAADRDQPAIALVDAAGGAALPVAWTVIALSERRLAGPASPLTERLLNQLRRYGIRFNYEAHDGSYRAWQ